MCFDFISKSFFSKEPEHNVQSPNPNNMNGESEFTNFHDQRSHHDHDHEEDHNHYQHDSDYSH
jgi:hypothetical protein